MVGKCKLLQFTQDKFDSAHWSVFFWCNTVRAYMSNIPGLSQSSNDQMFITTFFMCFLHDIQQTAEAAQKAHMVTVCIEYVKNKQARMHSTRCHCVLRDRRRKIQNLYNSERSASVVPFVERTRAMQKIQDIFPFFPKAVLYRHRFI